MGSCTNNYSIDRKRNRGKFSVWKFFENINSNSSIDCLSHRETIIYLVSIPTFLQMFYHLSTKRLSLIPSAFYIGFHTRFKYELSGFYINVDSLKCRFESVWNSTTWNPSFSREADGGGGGITDDTLLPWKRDRSHHLTALSPLDPNGRIPIRVRIVCTSSGNRATDSFKLHSFAIRMERNR